MWYKIVPEICAADSSKETAAWMDDSFPTNQSWRELGLERAVSSPALLSLGKIKATSGAQLCDYIYIYHSLKNWLMFEKYYSRNACVCWCLCVSVCVCVCARMRASVCMCLKWSLQTRFCTYKYFTYYYYCITMKEDEAPTTKKKKRTLPGGILHCKQIPRPVSI